ncbi:Secreted protein, partial [Phytophthora megakarya]
MLGLSDDDAVAELIIEFNLRTRRHGVISFASGHMRAMLDKFLKVLQIDYTHQTNQYNYQLLTVVAMDQFGRSQPVQYLLIKTNSDWHMVKCMDDFKCANEHWRF